jgi:hypothetical protein
MRPLFAFAGTKTMNVSSFLGPERLVKGLS